MRPACAPSLLQRAHEDLCDVQTRRRFWSEATRILKPRPLFDNFGNPGVPGKPDFCLQGWKSGDFGNCILVRFSCWPAVR